MRARIQSVFLLLSAGIVLLISASCNYPGRTPTPIPAAQYTQAAQTIIAQLTEFPTAATLAQAEPGATRALTTPVPTVFSLPTGTATRLPSPTATEARKLVSSDNFDDETGWFTQETDTFSLDFTAGGYRITVNQINALIWSIRKHEAADVSLEVFASRMAGPADGYYGLVCRHLDGENYYLLVIGSDGFYSIGKVVDNELEFLVEGQDTSGQIHLDNAVNQIRGDCVGETLKLYANGKLLAETEDDQFSSGTVGLIAGTRQSPGLQAWFDDFSIYQPLP